ncbi:T9SS type A sorting domain-containing protein [Adhaeribacter terreus]|uniref:T9SS type A sorting domain-containing protein n=1 Tax=Adhaeribacter terreus TaxID=529703 RepID=A0ABW0E7S1_9BACT
MTALFTSKFLTAAFTVLLLSGADNNVMAQENALKFRPGKLTIKPSDSQYSSHARTNGMVSRPGNSMDYTVDPSSGNWQLQSSSTYTYDSQGRLTQRLYTTPASGQNLGRERTTYDAKGNETEYLIEEWDGTAWQLTDGYRTLITYNTKGNKTELIYELWDSNNGIWAKDGREQTVYDANDLVTSLTYSVWDGTAWELDDRILVSNVGGVATSVNMQDFDNGVWVDTYRGLNLTWHVLHEIPSAYILEAFDNGVWVKDEKYSSVYDANGGHVGIYEDWTGTAWINSSRETETYDNNKNFTGWLEESWNATTSTWVYNGEERQVLTYSGIDVTERIYQDSWGTGTSTLVNRYKEVYSNFQLFNVSGVKNLLAETAVNVFPNPATNVVMVSIPENKGAFTATIADVTGKIWLSQTFRAGAENALNMEALPKGMYLLQLQTEAGSTVKRIIKQ